jgi:nicotinamide-nucleotide amidase
MPDRVALRAWILSQGEELLTGRTVDTNAAFLAGALTDLGLRVLGASTAGDRLDDIRDVILAAAARADVVICTGGLGPTGDDLTAAAVSAAFDRPLALDPVALDEIRARYAGLARVMPESNQKQALLPHGSLRISNPVGTAPGFMLTADTGARLYFLPGVPREMRRMWEDSVRPSIQSCSTLRPPRRHVFQVMGLGESQLQDLLGSTVARYPGIELGFRARIPENDVKLVAEEGTPGFELCRDEVRALLGRHCFSEEEGKGLAAVIGDALLARAERLAVAESCTGGLVADLCVSEAGSSRWFERGWITYSNRSKQEELGVTESCLTTHGAVSIECVREMAAGARKVSGVQWAVAISGVAGPGGGSASRPVGMVCFAVDGPSGAHARTLHFGDRGRAQVRRFAAATALEMLRRQLLRIE